MTMLQQSMHGRVFTIGHSNMSWLAFLRTLSEYEVEIVVDVRSTPFSHYVPHFNRQSLDRNLTAQGIGYRFAGKRLGGRPSDPSHYSNGKVDYRSLERDLDFRRAMGAIICLAQTTKLSLMCSEGDPLKCHRFLLLSRYLKGKGVNTFHVLPSGTVEDQDQMEERLLAMTGLMQGELWRSGDHLDRAYEKQTREVAFSQGTDGQDRG